MLDRFSELLVGFGVPPVVGGMVLGIVFGFLLRGWLWPVKTAAPAPGRPASSGMRTGATVANYVASKALPNNASVLFDPLNVPPYVQAEVVNLLAQDHKIEAIKRLRETTGLGLKECKDLVDALGIQPGQ